MQEETALESAENDGNTTQWWEHVSALSSTGLWGVTVLVCVLLGFFGVLRKSRVISHQQTNLVILVAFLLLVVLLFLFLVRWFVEIHEPESLRRTLLRHLPFWGVWSAVYFAWMTQLSRMFYPRTALHDLGGKLLMVSLLGSPLLIALISLAGRLQGSLPRWLERLRLLAATNLVIHGVALLLYFGISFLGFTNEQAEKRPFVAVCDGSSPSPRSARTKNTTCCHFLCGCSVSSHQSVTQSEKRLR